MEYRTEDDVKQYINKKEIEVIDIEQPAEVKKCMKCIDACLSDHLNTCERLGILGAR
jgi:ERCC4-related helicase